MEASLYVGQRLAVIGKFSSCFSFITKTAYFYVQDDPLSSLDDLDEETLLRMLEFLASTEFVITKRVSLNVRYKIPSISYLSMLVAT
jgi:hypothetical protein